MRVLSSAPENTWRFNCEIRNLFHLVVEETCFVFGVYFGFFRIFSFSFIDWPIFSLFSLFFKVFLNFGEVKVV